MEDNVVLMMEVDCDLVSRKEHSNTITLGKSASFPQLLHCSKYKRLFLYTLLEDYLVIG